MQLMDRIKRELQVQNKSVLKLSNETGISAYKIYKWFDGKGSPKHEDSKRLEEWLGNKMEEVPRGTNGSNTLQDESGTYGKPILPDPAQPETKKPTTPERDYRLLYEQVLERIVSSPELSKGQHQLVYDLEQKLFDFLSELKAEQERQRHLIGTMSQNLRLYQAEVGNILKLQQPSGTVQGTAKKVGKSHKG